MSSEINISELTHSSNQIESQIVEVAKELYPEYTQSTCRKWLKKLLTNENQKLFVAKRNGDIVGMLTLTVYPTIGGYEKAWVEDFAVLKAYQGVGIGKGLLDFAIRKTKKMAVSAINLTSRPERKVANALYIKMGFDIVHTNHFKLVLDKS